MQCVDFAGRGQAGFRAVNIRAVPVAIGVKRVCAPTDQSLLQVFDLLLATSHISRILLYISHHITRASRQGGVPSRDFSKTPV